MCRKTCGTCNGEGVVWNRIPRLNDWSESKGVCETCHGEGDLPLSERDFDGARVRIIASGVCGTCNIFGDHTILVMHDDDSEYDIASLEEVELCS